MAKKYALLIANTEYRDGKLASLNHPGLAFGELAEALKDPARGAFNQVETLVNANLSHVLNSLDRFFSRKPADAVLLVYVGGHGFVDAQGELFLALKESDRIRLKSTALMAAVLGMNMDQCPSPHKVLLLDCHYHSPFQDAPAGASLRIDPARIFAGRGFPKVIFSTGESTPDPVVKPPPTTTPVTGKLPIIPRDFTRTLAETLRTPSSAPGSRSAFTMEDWCKEVAVELKASRAEAPLLFAVGDPPATVLRGASLPRPDLSLSGYSGDTSVLLPPLASEPEGDWSRLSGIFPLEMIAPELAPATRAEAPAGIEASHEFTPPAAEETGARHLEDSDAPAADLPPATPAAATDIPPIAPTAKLLAQGWGDTFAALRARLEAQEQEEREARLRQEQEEAAQREKLNRWKQRWAARIGDADPGEELSPSPLSLAGSDTADGRSAAAGPAPKLSEYQAKAAALQKTLFMDNPYAEPEARSPREPTSPAAAAPVQGVPDGMATVIMPKELFLNTGAVKAETPLLPGATLVVSREEFLGESHDGIAKAPTREDRASAFAGSPSASAAHPGGRESVPAGSDAGSRRLALWILAGLLPVGLGLFVYFGYLSGLFAAFGLEGPARNISVTQILSAPPAPAAPPAAEQPAPALPAATGTAPAPAAPAAPSPAVESAHKERTEKSRASRTVPEEDRLALARRRQDSVIAFRRYQDSILTAQAQAKQDSLALVRPQSGADNEADNETDKALVAEALADRASGSKAGQDSLQPSKTVSKADMRAEKLLRASVAQTQRAEAKNIRGLYNRFALVYPGLEGDVVITLLVAPNGEIEKGTLTSSTTGLSIFDRVVLGNVMDWKLRPFRSAAARSIAVTLHFPAE